jgi:hypothetical protein
MNVSDYHKLPIAQKRTAALARMREPARTCPGGCGMQVTSADLLSHLEQRCTGKLEPGPGAKWVTHAEALAMGIARATLSYWSERRLVRTRIVEDGYRQYLHGDLVERLAERKVRSRR